ncbi:hypothetical protein PQX77_017088 [Marasmius sp. AFHP31]|nr:hypothetical protein PQX77_017088 [Marasmius sp. AFHP31]
MVLPSFFRILEAPDGAENLLGVRVVADDLVAENFDGDLAFGFNASPRRSIFPSPSRVYPHALKRSQDMSSDIPLERTGTAINTEESHSVRIELEDAGEARSSSLNGRDLKEPSEKDHDSIKTVTDTEENAIRDEGPASQNHPLEESWKAVMREVTSLDDGLAKGWNDDLDTLLVFAGLFSAVVTAFTIESYRWLEEAPEDTAVELLRQISQQLNSSEAVASPPPFEIPTSVIRINALWFLSLILSLVDALFALLCKQWIREHRQPTHTRTPEEALALRWVRKRSLEKWHVSTILSLLPLILELSLVLFFGGLLEFLQSRHPTLFKMALIAIAASGLFYVATTIAPSIDMIRQALQVESKFREVRTGDHNRQHHSPIELAMGLPPMEYVCPYKSPQAWIVYQGFRYISRLPSLVYALFFLSRREVIRALRFLLRRQDTNLNGYSHHKSSTWATNWTMSKHPSWPSVDLEALQRSNACFVPHFHELNALRWLVGQLRDNPIMLPHLKNILLSLPPHLVMPCVLDEWIFPPGKNWTTDDIKFALETPDVSVGPLHDHTYYRKSLDFDREAISFNNYLHLSHLLVTADDQPEFDLYSVPLPSPELWGQSLQIIFHAIGLMDRIFSGSDTVLNHDFLERLPEIPNGAGLDFRRIFMSAMPWSSSASSEIAMNDVIILMDNLGRYISDTCPYYSLHSSTTTTSSWFVRSKYGLPFIRALHTTIVEMDVVAHTTMTQDIRWVEAIDIVRRVHGLPVEHFEPMAYYFPFSLSKLEDALRELSPGDDSSFEFGYLDSYREYWDIAHTDEQVGLIDILISHINEYPPGANSPLVLSPSGIELISFVNQLPEFPQLPLEVSARKDRRVEWHTTLKKIFSSALTGFEAVAKRSRSMDDEADLDTNKAVILIFKHLWSYVNAEDQRRLVRLVSTHIDSHPPDLHLSPAVDSDTSPACGLSPEVLGLVVFINNRLADDEEAWRGLGNHQRAWNKASSRVKQALGLATGSYFMPIHRETSIGHSDSVVGAGLWKKAQTRAGAVRRNLANCLGSTYTGGDFSKHENETRDHIV